MIDTFLLGNTYNAESKEIRNAIKLFDAPAPMQALRLLWHEGEITQEII